jgi:Kelch motif
LDFNTQKWELLAISRPEIDPDQPIGRYRHEIAIDDRYIYIFGGGTADRVFDLKTLPVFDLMEKKWGQVTTLPDRDVIDGYPKPRKCHSLVQHTVTDIFDEEETCVYVAGGMYQGGPLNDLWRLSLKTLRWTRFKQTSLRSSLFFHDACITSDGCMYIFGGITTNHSRTNKLLKVWVTIPKLSAIAWEALIHYYPKMHNAPKSFMLEKGIPMHFANRVHP